MGKCKCNILSYVYINDNGRMLRIYTDDYQIFRDNIRKNGTVLYCKNGHIMIEKKINDVEQHFSHEYMFKHKNNRDIGAKKSSWRRYWKEKFTEINVSTEHKAGCKRSWKINMVSGKMAILLPVHKKGKSLKNDYKDMTDDVVKNGYEVIWIIKCMDNTLSVINLDNDKYLIKFIANIWKYTDFKFMEHIYLDDGEYIYRIKPNDVRSNIVYTSQRKLRHDFVSEIHENKLKYDDVNLYQCNLYFNQRGAGCGKTYESIQLLNCKDKLFVEKNTFIFLTKMNTVKRVMFEEFRDQFEGGKLPNLKDVSYDDSGRQFVVNYTNDKTNAKCRVIFATIDSFMFCIGNRNHGEKDPFYGILKSIKDGYVKNPKMIYAGKKITLCTQTLIIIDEAQDLEPEYIQAILVIMNFSHIDTYIIGDALQSIWGDNNVFTYMKNNRKCLPENINFIKGDDKNVVRRFHNEKFINFVNSVIDFEKHSLKEITGICDGSCKYKHDDEIVPFHIFELKRIYGYTDTDECKINGEIDKIMKLFEREVNENNYLPKNFMIIFPYLNRNVLAERLEIRIQKFWKEKFTDEKYKKNIVMTDNFWRGKYDDKKYFQFAFLHKANEGQSIDLRLSENSTRLMSIHASKGSGCEVVFLLGVEERIFHFYSNVTGSLQYDSLLHVGITRQKIKLYVGLNNDSKGDEIYERFSKIPNINIVFDETIKPGIDQLIKKIQFDKISQLIYNNSVSFNNLNDKFKIIKKNNIESENSNDIIDWGYHIIRNAVFRCTFLICIYNNKTYYIQDDQFKTIMIKISYAEIKQMEYTEYYEHLDKLIKYDSKTKDDKTKDDKLKYIPVLYFTSFKHCKYYKYKDIIINFIKKIQIKIKKALKENIFPKLCPMECVIFLHILTIWQHGRFTDVPIMDVYNTIYYYDEVFYLTDKKHSGTFKCICDKMFVENKSNKSNMNIDNSAITKSIINHYDKTLKINGIFEEIEKYLARKCKNEKFKFNIFHNINMHVPNYYKDGTRIGKMFDIIAYSDRYVVNFVLKPQFNKLNFNETLINLITDQYIISNCSAKGNDINKFKNKEIIHCVVSLVPDKANFYIFKQYQENIEDIDILISNSVKEHYQYLNTILYRFFKYYYDNRKRICNGANVIEYIYKIISNNIYATKYPEYLFNFVRELIRKYDLEEYDYCRQIFNKKDSFIELINTFISKMVNNIFNITEKKTDIF